MRIVSKQAVKPYKTPKMHKMKKEPCIATKFVSHEISPLEHLKDCQVYQLRVKLNSGEKLTRIEKKLDYPSGQ